MHVAWHGLAENALADTGFEPSIEEVISSPATNLVTEEDVIIHYRTDKNELINAPPTLARTNFGYYVRPKVRWMSWMGSH